MNALVVWWLLLKIDSDSKSNPEHSFNTLGKDINVIFPRMLKVRILKLKVTAQSVKVKLATVVEGDPKAPFLIATHRDAREGATPFPGLLNFTLDTRLIMPSVKQRGNK